ncbi:Pre-mRNA-splicing factor 18, partial [Linum perenne]
LRYFFYSCRIQRYCFIISNLPRQFSASESNRRRKPSKMDALQQELQRKRQNLAQETGGRRFFKRSEIEKKEIQKLREQEKRELEAKAARKSANSDSKTGEPPNSTPSSSSAAVASTAAAAASTSTGSKSLTNEQNIENLDLPRLEVIRRLRFLKQPITLFGEDDDARLDRLKYVLKAGLFEVDSDMTEGQTNDFLRDIAELRKRQKSGIPSERKRKDREGGGGEDGEGGKGEGELSGDGGSSGLETDKDVKRMKANFEDLCDEDKILVFFKRLLNEWHQELDEMPDAEKRTAKGKSMVATFKQCARYLSPLFKFCRKKVLGNDIRRALMIMVNFCMERDYLAAMDHYIKLAIGNAPWPIGVTMVDDETTRKYLQSVKRLMTFCQRRYPTAPSKAVEFNSLANGSDLHSLLAEEARLSGGNESSENRLRLMPAPAEN